MTTTSGLPLDTLGSQIKAHITAGDKAIDKAEQHYKAAGIHLMEAHARIKQTREMRWSAFLFSHARISHDTARNYMALAAGTVTLADLRGAARERMRAVRAKRASAGAAKQAKYENVLGRAADASTDSTPALTAAFWHAIDHMTPDDLAAAYDGRRELLDAARDGMLRRAA
jgi:hypothetical protein